MRDPRVRAGLIGAVAIGATLLLTQVILPKGTPAAILFAGLVLGLLNALLAVGIVLIYRSHRIINFAQAALGAAGAVFTYHLAVFLEWPFLLAFVGGVFVSIMVAMVFELAFVRRFFNAPRLVLTVITIATIPALSYAAGFITALPLFGDVQDRSIEELAGRAIEMPFGGWQFQVGRLPLDFGFAHAFAVGVALLSLGGLAAFLRFSRTGIAIRAAAENAERARLLGISVGALSLVVWTISGVLGGVSVTSLSAVQSQFGAVAAPPELLLIALSAAVFARMRSMPIAVLAAVLISVVKEAVEFRFQEEAGIVFIGLFVLLAISLVLAGVGERKRGRRSEEAEASSWKATDEARPIPKEMIEVSGIRLARRFLIGVGFVAILIFPWVVTTRQTNLAGVYAIYGIVLLSLTVLTGWAGQVSLGQFAFVGVGAVVGGALTNRIGLSFWLALLIVPFLTAGISVLVGIPALRIRGLFLAIATYAMAFAVEVGLFEEKFFGWLLPGRVDRPQALLLDFEDERSMYYLSLAGLVVAVLLVSGLRKTRPGRVLIGMRDNENNVRSFGIDPVRMKLTAFAVSGFLCGFAGVLLAHHQRAVQAEDYAAGLSLNVFLYAVVGGVGSILGVVLGGIFFAARELVTNDAVIFLIGPLGILLVLYAAPGGLASVALGLRDAVLRIVAQRRQMVVPALFADYDPTALERRLIPLTETIPQAGLAALPVGQRYRADSGLYGQRGRLVAAKTRSGEEAAAIGAAAEGAREADRAAATGALEGATDTGATR